MNRLIAYAVVALLLLPLAGCTTFTADEGGLGFKVSPLASLERVQEGEAAAQELAEELGAGQAALAAGQAALATELGLAEEAAKALAVKDAAAQALAKKEIADAILEAKDDAQIDWTELILAVLGLGAAGAGTVAGGLKYRSVLLNKPAPGQKAAA